MSQEGTIALLKDAYQLEVEGWLFYRGLLDSLPKGEVRDVFVYLAEQEQKHQSYIGGEISRLQEGKSLDMAALQDMKETAHDQVLADAVRSTKDLTQHEASAIHTGMLLERNSWEFYHAAADKAGEPDEAAMYRQLEEWEKLHLHLLENAYDLVKERIWAENQFAPF